MYFFSFLFCYFVFCIFCFVIKTQRSASCFVFDLLSYLLPDSCALSISIVTEITNVITLIKNPKDKISVPCLHSTSL